MKTFMPVSLDIYNKKILIVGGGKVAGHKVQLLKRFTNSLHVIGLSVSDAIKREAVAYTEKEFEASDLEGFFMVYACTDDRELNRDIKLKANALGKLVNVADDPELCDFVSPAIYREGNMTVAVSSNGEDVMKSIKWRNRIREFFENDKSGNL